MKNKKPEKKVAINFVIEESKRDKLKKLAHRRYTTLSDLLRWAIDKLLSDKQKK